MKIEASNLLKITDCPPELAVRLKEILTNNNPKYSEAIKFGRSTWQIPRLIKQYEIVKDSLVVPRGMLSHIKSYVNSNNIVPEFIDKRVTLNPVIFENDMAPRDHQIPIIRTILDKFKNPVSRQGLVVAPPGTGKTFMALNIAANLQQPCLWLTHTNPLMEQARSHAIKHGFDEEIIGKIQGKKMDIRPLTIASVHTMAKRDIDSISNNFGMTVLDEAHHAPASTFTNVLIHINSMYLLGCTATDFRRDGLEFLMFNILGDRLAWLDPLDTEDMGRVQARIYMIFTGMEHGYINPHTMQEDYNYMIDKMIKNNTRTTFIVNDIMREYISGQRCIVLSSRVNHCKTIYKMLLDLKVPTVLAVATSMSKKGIDEAILKIKTGEAKVIVATLQLIAEGFDCRPLSRGFFATPVSGQNRGLLTQTIGRIERSFEGKEDAAMYDYVDDDGVLIASGRKRLYIYVNANMDTTFLQITDSGQVIEGEPDEWKKYKSDSYTDNFPF